MGFLDKLFGKKQKEEPKKTEAPSATETEQEDADDEWEDQGTPQEMNPSEVETLLQGDNPPALLDVREKHELDADGFIPGSVHIPLGELESRVIELDLSKSHVVYCASGMRSFDAGFCLIQNGCKDVVNLNGGIKAWTGEKEFPGE